MLLEHKFETGVGMSHLVPFTEAIAPVRSEHAALIEEVCAWCSEHAEPTDPDLIALVLAGIRPFDDEEKDPTLWTRIGVRALLRCGIPNWCSLHRTTWPLEVLVAVWRWLDFLQATSQLNPASDPLWELRKPLICYGGLDFQGRPRPEDAPALIPCECYLPYWKSAEYLNERIEQGALIGDVLTWEPAPDERPVFRWDDGGTTLAGF